MSARFLDLHVVQPMPFSLLNRDDLGSHKTMDYATPRLRVSSQSWKRAMRDRIEAAIVDAGGDRSFLTKRLPVELTSILVGRGWDGELAKFAAVDAVNTIGHVDTKSDGTKSSELIFLSGAQIAGLADVVADRESILRAALSASQKATKPAADAGPAKGKPKKADPAEKAYKAELAAVIAPAHGTVALLGRMLAGVDNCTVDGAVSVAHAFTTHTAAAQDDFFTAVDDLNLDSPEAAQLGSTEHGAGVYYRYGCVDVVGLLRNCDGDVKVARHLCELFLDAFVRTVPSAKQRSTGAYTLPDLVAVTARSDLPRSYAGGFERPVRSSTDGFSAPSRTTLASYAARQAVMFGTHGTAGSWYVDVDGMDLPGLGQACPSVDDIVTSALTATGL